MGSECTLKYENMASYNADFIVPDLIGFFDVDRKKIKRQIKNTRIFMFVKNARILLREFAMNFLRTLRENTVSTNFYFPLKIKSPITIFITFDEILKK